MLSIFNREYDVTICVCMRARGWVREYQPKANPLKGKEEEEEGEKKGEGPGEVSKVRIDLIA